MALRNSDGLDYAIVSVEPAEAPQQEGGTDWFRYVIDQGDNRICGYRRGSRQAVVRSVEQLVVQLNERRIGPKGRVHLYMSPRGKPATRK